MNLQSESAPHRVLVVDDNQANRQLLRAYLTRLGMQAITAENGLEALDVCARELPDIVLMDVMMPVMDGLTATRKLRERCTERWLPIVMLSALGTEADVSSALDNGADDYLVKPISYTVFAARMRAISRSLALQRESELARGELQAISAALQRHHEEAERDNALARDIIERDIGGRGLADPAIAYRLPPARRFSGDLVLAARAPSGQLFALLADATGRGLAAAVRVLPAVSEFYRVVALSPTPHELVSALSRTLHGALPPGRFVAAALVCLDAARTSACVWNGGMPDVFHLDVEGRAIERLRSRDLPLGIEPLAPEDVSCETVALAAGEQLFVFSDGLLDALSPDGGQYDYEAIADTLAHAGRDARLAALERALVGHCTEVLPNDDVSMLLVSA